MKLLCPDDIKPGGILQHVGLTILSNPITHLPLCTANPEPRLPLKKRNLTVREGALGL